MGQHDYTEKHGGVVLKHIEVDGCVVNIRTGLHDNKGRRVTSVEIIPDDRFAGERVWRLYGTRNNRVVELKKAFQSR